MVDELDESLHTRGYAVDRLHGDMAQAQRDRVMSKFRDRKFEFLIATDVAARGLDVDDLEVVFNFDLPNDAEDYTHRIGRTGRAGKSGRAFTFVSGREIYKLQFMIRTAKLKIRRERIPSIDQVEEARENVFFEKIRATLEEGKFAKQDRMIDRLIEQGFAPTDISSALIHLLRDGEPGKPTAPAATLDAPPRYQAPDFRDEPPARSPFPPHREKRQRSFEQPEAPRGRWLRRTGNEEGFTTIAFNVGRAHGVTPADIVGKIAGVTRLTAKAIGAIDLLDQESYVDVADENLDLVVNKMPGVMMRGMRLQVRRVDAPVD
jgi:ATP-dependent RNA helicase DeaD